MYGFERKKESLYVKVPTNLRDFFNQEGVLLLTSKVPLVADKSKEMSAKNNQQVIKGDLKSPEITLAVKKRPQPVYLWICNPPVYASCR